MTPKSASLREYAKNELAIHSSTLCLYCYYAIIITTYYANIYISIVCYLPTKSPNGKRKNQKKEM